MTDVVSGKGHGKHRRSPYNKEGEVSASWPSHSVPSQRGTYVNIDISTSIVVSSQNVIIIEKRCQ